MVNAAAAPVGFPGLLHGFDRYRTGTRASPEPDGGAVRARCPAAYS